MSSTVNIYAENISDVKNITKIDFSMYTNKQVEDESVISDPNGITVEEISNNGEPVQGGVIDRRLGPTESKVICATCGESAIKCPGHFGHIRLADPVFHMGYIQYLKSILACICIRCHKLLTYKKEEDIARLIKNKHGKLRFAGIKTICKGVTHCGGDNYGCGTPAHKITIDKKYGSVLLLAEPLKKVTDVETGEKKNEPQILTPQLCYDILKGVSDEDCMIMGFDPAKSRPEDMIIKNFPVPPVAIRPSIKMSTLFSSTMDDDLTHKLLSIIRSNENLKNIKGDGSIARSTATGSDFTFLQIHVTTFFSNNLLNLKSVLKNGREIKPVSERLTGKEGRIRGNLMGKRVDMSARSVITSDPNISIGQVGVPLMIASNLTYPEIVTKNNHAYLTKLVQNGRKGIYPGANYVIKNFVNDEGKEISYTYDLKLRKEDIKLSPGDIVERHLIDGDIILFNRQPSLHKLSMMAHKIHVINNPEYMTFRLNVNVTNPYNADWYRFILSRSWQQVAASMGVGSPLRENSVKPIIRYNHLVSCY